MLRWVLLLGIVAFVISQVMRMRPSARDDQLLQLRQTAREAGLQVRFWTRANSGYTQVYLPETGFSYTLPYPRGAEGVARWGLWVSEAGEFRDVVGTVPPLAKSWLESFRQRYPGAWALLESNEAGLSVLWPERGDSQAMGEFVDAIQLLQKSI